MSLFERWSARAAGGTVAAAAAAAVETAAAAATAAVLPATGNHHCLWVSQVTLGRFWLLFGKQLQ